MPHAICVTLVTRFVSIIQVSKCRVQTCKINFYCSDDLFLKTLRNNQIQVFLFPFFCCISPFLLSRCILFCDLQCDASFTAFCFSLSVHLFTFCGTKIRGMKVPSLPNLFLASKSRRKTTPWGSRDFRLSSTTIGKSSLIRSVRERPQDGYLLCWLAPNYILLLLTYFRKTQTMAIVTSAQAQ